DEVCDVDNGELGPLERRPLTGFDPCEKSNAVFGTDAFDENNMRVTTWRSLTIDTVQASLTQNLSPTANMQIGLFGQVLNGFQENPYRRVLIGVGAGVPALPQESVPDVRGRVALMVRVNRFLPPLRAAIHGTIRGYSDTWGVQSGTVEMAYSQYLGDSLLARFRARVYQQSAATFFKDAALYQTESTAGEYFTGDRELSPLRNILLGSKLSLLSSGEDDEQVWGVFDRLQFNLKVDVLFLSELEDAPDKLDELGELGTIENQFLNSGQLLDGFIIQLGLLLAY
ncbi:MAG: DUF3570 domain-containing protein, partial [Myxococcota bacterium]